MAMPRYANLDLDLWLHRGRLGLIEPSLCLFHETIRQGAPLLEALNELRNGKCPTKLTITFSHRRRALGLLQLRLLYVIERDDLRIMSIRHEGDAAIVEMTAEGLELLNDGLTAWLAGAEDFGVCARHSNVMPNELGPLDQSSGELWFWGPQYAGP